MRVLFTFHHVSIKTHNSEQKAALLLRFTFHHVSIKTSYLTFEQYQQLGFTFHHVSIKTVMKQINICYFAYSHSTMYLLKRYKQ